MPVLCAQGPGQKFRTSRNTEMRIRGLKPPANFLSCATCAEAESHQRGDELSTKVPAQKVEKTALCDMSSGTILVTEEAAMSQSHH